MDWRTIENDREKYAAYLCSREWSERREAVRHRSGGQCERCRYLPMDSCHHLTYARKYDESLEDLQAICDPCHRFTHGKSDFDPRSHYGLIRYFQVCRELEKPAAPIEVLIGQKGSFDFEKECAAIMWSIETLNRERDSLMRMESLLSGDPLSTFRLYGVHVRMGSIGSVIERSENLPFVFAEALQWQLIGRYDDSTLRYVAEVVGVQFAKFEEYSSLNDEHDFQTDKYVQAFFADIPLESLT